MAGGGIKPGIEYGMTDEMGYMAAENPVAIRDLHATMLNQLGLNHKKLSVKFQGLNQKLTGVKPASVIKDLIA